MLSRTFRAFQSRQFRLLWFGACTSSVGTWMQKLAQSWLVLEISGSAFLLGVDAFLGEIPIFLFSLAGGVMADRRDRRNILLASQVVQMSAALLLAGLLATGTVRVWHILCLSFVTGLAQAFGGPAYQALIPTLVRSEDLSNAIAMNSVQFNLARIIGPVIGGIVMAKFGAAWCFGLNGVFFLAVIVSLLMVRSRFQPAPAAGSLLESLKQGIGFIRRREAMGPLMALAFLMTMLGIPAVVFLPVFTRDVFQGGPNTYTLLLSVSGAGSILGALVVATFSHRSHLGRIAVWMIVLLGLLIGAFALSSSLVLSCILIFLASAALIAVFALISSLVQFLVQDEMRGRVMSVYNVAFRGGMPFGSLASGRLMEVISAPAVIALNGGLLFVLGVYFLLGHRKIAQL